MKKMGDRYDTRDIEEERFVKMCPICDICGERITDDYFYEVGGMRFHLDCADRRSVESYVEEQKYGY